MRIFKTKNFHKFSQKHQISDDELAHLILQMEQGLIGANLGNGVFKQRLAKCGRGKSSGYRIIIIYRIKSVAFFVVGFEKNQQQNLSSQEIQALKQSADIYLNLTEQQILNLLLAQKLIEIPTDQGHNNDEI